MQSEKEMISGKVAAILGRMEQARVKFNIQHPVRLVAVSKTKTVEEIQEAYNCGLRHFGQNYVDEIEQKAPKLPQDIRWHFIGHLQSNKIKKVLVPNLEYLQTVDRDKQASIQASLAEKLEKELAKQNRNLNILIQVKTSEEDSKSGVNSEQLDKLYNFIVKECPHLVFKGLMTIGQQGDLAAFGVMNQLRKELCQKYALKGEEFQLSMGMSGDFQEAIAHHSTSVRVGSSIFGQRNYKQ